MTHYITAPVLPLFLGHDLSRKTLKQIVSDANLFVRLPRKPSWTDVASVY